MQALGLKRPELSGWVILFPLAAAIAASAVYAPWVFALLLGPVLFYYFWKHQAQLVLFLLVYTPFEEFILKMMPDSLYAPVRFMWEGLLFAMIALILFERLFLSKTWKKSIVDKLILVFLAAWGASTVLNNISPTFSALHIKNLIRYISVFYIVYNLKPDKEFLRKTIHIIIAIGVFEGVLCLGQAVEGDILVKAFEPREVVVGGEVIRGEDMQTGSYHTIFSGTFARANDLGNYLALSLCFLAAVWFVFEKRKIYLLAALPMIAALILTSSRISWISIFVAVGFMLFKIRHKLRFAYFIVPIVLLAIVLTGTTLAGIDATHGHFNVLNRFLFMFTPDYIDIMASGGRLYAVLVVAPAVFLANPVLGLGPGSFMKISKQMTADQVYGKGEAMGLETGALRYVHDVGYTAIFVQTGLVGLLALAFIFVRIFRKASQAFKREPDRLIRALYLGGMGFIIAVAIQNLASFNLLYRNQSLLIWAVLGLILLYYRCSSLSVGKEA